jgi:hypothetical protein
VYADVGPRGREVELIKVSSSQGPVRPPQGEPRAGERRRRDEVGVGPANDERAGRRRRYDDPGAVPSHTPLAGVNEEFEDFHRRLEAVLQGVPEGMWIHIQDEVFLEQCVGLIAESRTLIHRVAVEGATMTGRLPPGPEGPLASGAPPPERGPGGGALEAP